MTTSLKLEINNGSGWNNYAALRGCKLSRLLKVAVLAKKNNLQSIVVAPLHPDKPLGIAVRFFRVMQNDEPDLIYTIRFDQNDTAEDIAAQVKIVLAKGIDNTIEDNRRRINAEKLKNAIDAGFTSIEEHELHLENTLAKAALDAAAKKAALLADTKSAEDALDEMRKLRQAYPAAVRITRRGVLVYADESKETSSTFSRIDGMKAWLHQHGFRASVDDRHHFFAAAI